MAAKSTTTTLTAKQVQTGLSHAHALSSEEERAVRMRHGAKVELQAPLARKADEGSEAADEMLLVEMQLLKAYRAHLASQKQGRGAVEAVRPSTGNRAKDKIVRALRKKR
jgi:hypothetical protein